MAKSQNQMAPFALAGPEPPEWIQLAGLGRWHGHPARPYEIGRPEIQSMHALFQSDLKANQKALVIDFKHSSLRADVEGGAAGWINDTDVRAGGAELWGHVSNWLPKADAAIRAGEYRYYSPVYRVGCRDRVTGRPVPAMLHSVGLTNTPFLTELPALIANAWGADGQAFYFEEDGRMKQALVAMLALLAAMMTGQRRAEVANALGVGEDAPPKDYWKALVDQLAAPGEALPDTVANALGVVEGTTAEHFLDLVMARAQQEASKIIKLPDRVANELQVDPECDPQEALSKILMLRQNGDLAPIANELGLEGEPTLQAILAALRERNAAAVQQDAEVLIANAMRAGKVTPGMKDRWLELALADLERARAA